MGRSMKEPEKELAPPPVLKEAVLWSEEAWSLRPGDWCSSYRSSVMGARPPLIIIDLPRYFLFRLAS